MKRFEGLFYIALRHDKDEKEFADIDTLAVSLKDCLEKMKQDRSKHAEAAIKFPFTRVVIIHCKEVTEAWTCADIVRRKSYPIRGELFSLKSGRE